MNAGQLTSDHSVIEMKQVSQVDKPLSDSKEQVEDYIRHQYYNKVGVGSDQSRNYTSMNAIHGLTSNNLLQVSGEI